MKKNILFFTLLFIPFVLSACSSKPAINEEPLGLEELGNQNIESEVVSTNKETENEIKVNNIIKNNENNMIEENKIEETSNEILSPDKQPDLTSEYSQAVIKTNLGDITVKLFTDESPITVNNFLYLAKSGFYNGTKFHRIIKDFMIQGGDPLSRDGDPRYWGTGGPDYRFQDEINDKKLVLGSLAMANAGLNTNGSQFFIVTIPETPWLDGKHTNFGQVVAGMEIVKRIEAAETGINDRPLADVVIDSIELLK